MKKFWAILLMILALCFYGEAQAIGPIVTTPHMASCDAPLTGESIVGAYIYYRVVAATPIPWAQAQRVDAGAMWSVPYDLLRIGLASGQYELVATFYNAIAESAPSAVLPFPLIIPSAPVNFQRK
jgi:hypothetical protein